MLVHVARVGGDAALSSPFKYGVALAAFFLVTDARADGETPQIAQSLFDDARTLLEAGRYAEACRKFADSHRLEPAGGTLLNLALCHELEGKTATAWNEFREALSVAARDQRKDRADLAEEHIAALQPKLTRLTVVVGEDAAAELTVDRSPLPPAAWNAAIPVDPGEHRVRRMTGGVVDWETAVVTTEPGHTYVVEVPRHSLPVTRPVTTHRSTAFWTLLGGAGVLGVTSVVTGAMALNANAYVKDNCSEARDFCRVDDASDEASRARTLAWVSTITLGAAVGAAVVAFVLPRWTAVSAASNGVRIAF